MEQLGISKLDLKRQNRKLILKILKQKGPSSRIDIAKTLELTRATVTVISNELINQNILIETGEVKEHPAVASRGRKKVLININENYKFAIGVAIEKGAVAIGLSTLFGHVLDKRIMKLSGKTSFDEIVDFIKSTFDEVLSYNCLETDNIIGIGVGIAPCMYNRMKVSMKGDKLITNTLHDKLSQLCSVNVIIENYIKGAAMANIDFNEDKQQKKRNIAFLSFGNEYHFGVTNLNEPVRRYDNHTNFIDNIVINTGCSTCEPEGRSFGVVKNILTPHAIKLKVKSIMSKDNTPYLYELLKGDIDNLTPAIFFSALDNGDKEIEKLYQNIVELTAVLINNLIYSTNPERIVLHNFTIYGDRITDIIKAVSKMAGDDIASMIDISIINRKNSFLAGCSLAIREFFFYTGGMDK